jgi:hypothetical protein
MESSRKLPKPPWHNCGGTLRLNFSLSLSLSFSLSLSVSLCLSLSLSVRMVLHLGIWGKRSKLTTTAKVGNLRNWGPSGDLYWTANAVWIKLKPQCLEAFFLSILSSSTPSTFFL